MNKPVYVEVNLQGENPPLYTARTNGLVQGKLSPALGIAEMNCGFVPAWWQGDVMPCRIDPFPQGAAALPAAQLRPEELEGRAVPLWCKMHAAPGRYRIEAELFCEKGCPEALLFVGRRRLAWKGSLKAGQRQRCAVLCDVSPLIPRGMEQPVEDESLDVTLLAPGVRLCRVTARCADDLPTLYVMGDSTVADQSAELPYAPAASYCGWGQMLPLFAGETLCVSNHAHSGLTTESFLQEGHWSILQKLVRPGDTVVMQFGHNDQKLAHLQAGEGYRENLARYIQWVRQLGAEPVLVTPFARNSWKNPGCYNDMLAEYAAAVKQLGEETNSRVIDLHGWMKEKILAWGLEKSKAWFYPGDYTHANDFGGLLAAGYIAGQLGLPVKEEPWLPHGPHSPLAPPAGAQNPAGTQTDFSEYETQNPHQPLTWAQALELVIKTLRLFPINVYNDGYEDVVGHETYAGAVQCAVQNDLIPADLTEDGCLHPNREISLEDFLRILIAGYGGRRALEPADCTPEGVSSLAAQAVRLAVGAGLVGQRESWEQPLSRARAAEICRRVQL